MKSLDLTVLNWQKIICLCFAFALSAPVFAGNKIEVAKEDLSELKQKINALKQELESTQSEQKDVTDALKKSEIAISQANNKLREIARQQQNNQQKLTSLENQSLDIHQQLDQQQKKLSQLLYQQYTGGESSYAKLILQQKNPSELARQLQYHRYIAKTRAELITQMQANLGKVQTLNAQTNAAQQAVLQLKTAQEIEKQTLETQKQAKAKVAQNLSQEIKAQRGEIKKLNRDEKTLSQLVARLAEVAAAQAKKENLRKQREKQEKAREEKLKAKELALNKKKQKNIGNSTEQTAEKSEEKANEKTTEKATEKNKEATVIANNDKTPDAGDLGNFASLRGKLKLPVRGELMNRFGSARPDGGLTWKGLFIRAAEGAEVKAVAIGRVVFADWMRGFGNLIIVDHGNGYMSLYGNNQSLFKQVGEAVNPGDAIAAVGNSGGNASNGLYYELRRASRPFDPLSWSSLR